MKRFLTFIVAALAITGIFVGCESLESDPVNADITFTWTATGDDGTMGTATFYEVRFSTSGDSLLNQWTTCAAVSSVPTPQPAGSPEEFTSTVVMETGVEYFFAVKVYDEVGNVSPISNIVALTIPDEMAPAAVVDFNATK